MKYRTVFGALAAFLTAALAAAGVSAQECPSAEKIDTALKAAFRQPVQIKDVRPAPIPGLCEIVVSAQGQNNIIYMDPGARYLVTGHIVDAEAKRDLTRDALVELNRFSEADMKKLASLRALTVGTGGPEVYFVTDPQ